MSIPSWIGGQVSAFGFSIGVIQLLSIMATVVPIGLLTALLRFTKIGIAMRAAAQDFAIARLMGINANRAIESAFALSGLLVGAAGVLWIAQRGSVDPFMGFLPVIKAFIATVIGELGSLIGAAIGGMLLGALEVILRTILPEPLMPFRDSLSLLLVIALLLIRPNGLLGSTVEARQ